MLDVSGFNKEEGQLWVGLKKGRDIVLIGCIYRPSESGVEFTNKIPDSIRKTKERIERGD